MKLYKEIKDQHLFKDSKGHIVLYQAPNALLWAWLVLKALSLMMSKGNVSNGMDMLSKAILFTWAYLEITEGVNNFRRMLGFVVILSIVMSYFN